MQINQILLEQAADLIRHADGMLIGAGAGMGVDSGLPDFRGPEGFWRAYPALREAGLKFSEIASPDTGPRRHRPVRKHQLNKVLSARQTSARPQCIDLRVRAVVLAKHKRPIAEAVSVN